MASEKSTQQGSPLLESPEAVKVRKVNLTKEDDRKSWLNMTENFSHRKTLIFEFDRNSQHRQTILSRSIWKESYLNQSRYVFWWCVLQCKRLFLAAAIYFSKEK